jgi:hypothetical protein
MREAAMVRESKCRAFQPAEYIEIRSLGGQRQRSGRQRRLAIEPGAAHTRARKEMCDWFQAGWKILFGWVWICQTGATIANRSLPRGHQQSERVRNRGDLGGQHAHQLSIGFDIDFFAPLSVRSFQIGQGNPLAMRQIDPFYFPSPA